MRGIEIEVGTVRGIATEIGTGIATGRGAARLI
jgi:hypothetical protein